MTASTLTNVDTSNPLAKYQSAPTSSTTTTTSATGNAALDKLSSDYTTFLKLLTTQLQNQDPTSPMDSAQFTQQLVQYSSVEQQIKANQKLDSLVSLQQNSGTGTLLGYLGKSVEIDGNTLANKNGQGAQLSYTLPDIASSATVKIFDKDGKLIRTQDISKSLGKHVITWDGKNDSGSTANDGSYTFTVDAKDSKGNALTTKTTSFGLVDGLETKTTGSVLTIGDTEITLDKILAVKTASGT